MPCTKSKEDDLFPFLLLWSELATKPELAWFVGKGRAEKQNFKVVSPLCLQNQHTAICRGGAAPCSVVSVMVCLSLLLGLKASMSLRLTLTHSSISCISSLPLCRQLCTSLIHFQHDPELSSPFLSDHSLTCSQSILFPI